jgi:phage terminase large subunit-like protein
MGVEAIQSQYEIYRQLREKAQVKGLYNTRIYPVYTKTKKEERIEMLEPLIENSTIRFRHSQRLLREQLELFPNGNEDDLPDALAYAVELASKRKKRSHYQQPGYQARP